MKSTTTVSNQRRNEEGVGRLEAGIACRSWIELAGLAEFIAGFDGNEATAAEVEIILNTQSDLWNGTALAPNFRGALEINTAPTVEAISATITTPTVSTLLSRAIRSAVGKDITTIGKADGIPNTAKDGILFCAIGQLKVSLHTLNHCGFVGAGPLEIHISAGV